MRVPYSDACAATRGAPSQTYPQAVFSNPDLRCLLRVARAYKRAAVGNCAGTGAFIESKEECEAAATILGLLDDGAFRTSSLMALFHPYGCYYKLSQDTVYWNPDGGKADTDTTRVSLCWVAGQCGIATCHLIPGLGLFCR